MVSRNAFVIGFVKGIMLGSLLGGVVLLTVSVVAWFWPGIVIGLLVSGLSGYMIFSDSMNLVQAVGPLYWVIRQVEQKQPLAIKPVRMNETDYPWHKGRGLEVRWRHHAVQVGVCRLRKVSSEEEGLLGAVGGRDLDIEPQRIGREWQ
jgi:hypothetical protein